MFGIDEGQIGPFLIQRGFGTICNRTTSELKQLYFTGSNAGRVLSTGVAIVSARVNEAGGSAAVGE